MTLYINLRKHHIFALGKNEKKIEFYFFRNDMEFKQSDFLNSMSELKSAVTSLQQEQISVYLKNIYKICIKHRQAIQNERSLR